MAPGLGEGIGEERGPLRQRREGARQAGLGGRGVARSHRQHALTQQVAGRRADGGDLARARLDDGHAGSGPGEQVVADVDTQDVADRAVEVGHTQLGHAFDEVAQVGPPGLRIDGRHLHGQRVVRDPDEQVARGRRRAGQELTQRGVAGRGIEPPDADGGGALVGEPGHAGVGAEGLEQGAQTLDALVEAESRGEGRERAGQGPEVEEADQLAVAERPQGRLDPGCVAERGLVAAAGQTEYVAHDVGVRGEREQVARAHGGDREAVGGHHHELDAAFGQGLGVGLGGGARQHRIEAGGGVRVDARDERERRQRVERAHRDAQPGLAAQQRPGIEAIEFRWQGVGVEARLRQRAGQVADADVAEDRGERLTDAQLDPGVDERLQLLPGRSQVADAEGHRGIGGQQCRQVLGLGEGREGDHEREQRAQCARRSEDEREA